MAFRRSSNSWLIASLTCGLLAATMGSGCRARNAEPASGGAHTPKAQDARKKAELAVLEAVRAGSEAQSQLLAGVGAVAAAVPPQPPTPPLPPMPPQPPAPPTVAPTPPRQSTVRAPQTKPVSPSVPNRPAGQVVIRERVTSGVPYTSETEASDEALKQAQKVIRERFLELKPPMDYSPSLAIVKLEYARQKTVRPPDDQEKQELAGNGYSVDRVYVEYDIEVTDEQIRELRTHQRVADALRVVAGIAGLTLVGLLFLRLDEWSKGYLTSWLTLAALGLAAGVTVALIFL